MKKFPFFFALIPIMVTLLAACGGGSSSSSTSPANAITYLDKTNITSVRASVIGDSETFNVTGTLTKLSDNAITTVAGTVTKNVLSSTTTVNGTTCKIMRTTSVISYNGNASVTNIQDTYFMEGSTGEFNVYGYANISSGTSRIVTPSSPGFSTLNSGSIVVGSNNSFSATFNDGSTKTGSYNVTSTGNVSVSYGNYKTFIGSYSGYDSSSSETYSGTGYIIPAFGDSIKQIETGNITISGQNYSYTLTTELSSTNITF